MTDEIVAEERLPRTKTNDCSNVRDVNIIGSTSLVYTQGRGDVEKMCSKFTQQNRDRARIRTRAS